MKWASSLFLTKIRLSTYFWIFFVVYLFMSHGVPGVKFDAGALTLFLVNSFLYGFYISPILTAQKARIDALHQIIRAEANAMFGIMLNVKKLSPKVRAEVKSLIVLYIHSKLHKRKDKRGEKEYEKLISYCLDYKGADSEKIEALLRDLVANQKNRTDYAMQKANRVYANEWQIMAILFGITLGFVMCLNVGDEPLLHFVRALLCTGLTMLIVILVKLNTLTHKRAKQMWAPLQTLLKTRFHQIDQ